MNILKEFEARHTTETPTDADLETIKRFALRELAAEDVWLGKMALANDQVDRSGERFPISYLERFADTLPGKPVLTGHNQTMVPVGKFYSADVVPRSDGSGNDLIARYYLRAGNPLAADIELGIASGVSIGARADKRFCGICAKDYDGPGRDRCSHSVGHTYDGKTCTLEWGGDAEKVEALEGSFVASPCQVGAQALARNYDGSVLTKGHSPGAVDLSTPQGDAMELQQALEKITSLETEIAALQTWKTDNEPLIETGDIARKAALAEIQRKYTALEAEKTGQAIVKSLSKASFAEIGDADKDAQEMYDKKFPPRPLGDARDVSKSETTRPFDPVSVNPFQGVK
jgi:hypothetical protein